MTYAYETDGAAIYKQSFSIIRAESDLQRFDPDEEQVAVRMIHAAGLGAPHPLFARHGRQGARGAGIRGADPLRCAHGQRRRDPQTPARG